MPNYFQPMGPNGIVVSAPFTVVIETLFNYMLVAIEKIQSERIKSMIPKQSAIDHFSQFCQQYFPTTVFTDQVHSLYCIFEADMLLFSVAPGSKEPPTIQNE